MNKLIGYVLGFIDIILLLLVVGFAEEKPLYSFVAIALFALVSFAISRMWCMDEFLED